MAYGGYWFWSVMEHHAITDRMGFFIIFNVLVVGLVMTWQGVAFFRRMPGFWLFHGYWVVAHTLVYAAWGYWGKRIELCAFTLPLEAYWYYRIARSRFLQSLEVRETTSEVSET